MACFLGVVFVGVVVGIFFAVALAISAFLWRAWRPYSAVLGRVDGLKGYHDVSRYPDARRVDGLLLFRWDAPLFFANAELFREQVEAAIDAAPTPTRWLVVAAEPVTDVDMTAGDMVGELTAALGARGISLRFAELKDPTKDQLKRYGLVDLLGAHAFFPTVGSAVDAYVAETGIPWTDWEEGPPGRTRAPRQPAGAVSGARHDRVRGVLVLDVAEAEPLGEPAERSRAPTSSTCPSGASWPGTSSTRMMVASMATAMAMPTPMLLMVMISARANAAKTTTMISAAPVMTPAVSRQALGHRRGVVAGPAVGLLDARQQQHLVVHGQPEDHREHDDRVARDGVAERREVEQPRRGCPPGRSRPARRSSR